MRSRYLNPDRPRSSVSLNAVSNACRLNSFACRAPSIAESKRPLSPKMKFPVVSRLALLVGAAIASAEDDKVHGQGALGKDMGPVGFLWPKGRPWSASAVNTAPCGSQSGVGNRTMFPICKLPTMLSICPGQLIISGISAGIRCPLHRR